MYTKRVLSRECAALSLSFSHQFKYNMYICICIHTYDNDAKRLDCDPTRILFFHFLFSLLCSVSRLLPFNLREYAPHTRKTHTESLYYIQDIYNGVQLMRVNDRTRRQMRRQGDFARTLTSGRYRERGLATENRPTDRPGVVLS